MKKLIAFITMLVSLISLSACFGGSVTPFAYTSFKTTGDQVAYYTYSIEGTHVFIFENESSMPNGNDEKYKDNNAKYLSDCESNSIITISYKRSLGVEEVDGTKATLVEIDSWYYIEVIVKKNSSGYSPNKAIYLNETKLEKSNKHDSIDDSDSLIIYHFEDCGLKRSNPNGKINNVVNIIEYKLDGNEDIAPKEDESYMNMTLSLKIDNQIVDVYWADNDSVKALKELAKDGLTINMSEYGGFEQTGSIGHTLPSNDSRIDVVPGDIVLYNSNQISIFYNNSSWSYTKLGHINLSKNELKDLLDTDAVVVTFTLK